MSKHVNEILFDIATFLVMSARGCVDEPDLYAPFRLLDAISRLVESSRNLESYVPDSFLEEVKKRIDEKKDSLSLASDQEQFRGFIDGLVRDFAKELKSRAFSQDSTLA
jgi:hypothetical protein